MYNALFSMTYDFVSIFQHGSFVIQLLSLSQRLSITSSCLHQRHCVGCHSHLVLRGSAKMYRAAQALQALMDQAKGFCCENLLKREFLTMEYRQHKIALLYKKSTSTHANNSNRQLRQDFHIQFWIKRVSERVFVVA